MKQFFLLIFFLIIFTTIFPQTSGAQSDFRVDEEKTRFLINERKAQLLLALESNAPNFSAKFTCEILDETDKIRASVTGEKPITNGASVAEFSFDLPEEIKNDEIFYRLRYRIEPLNSNESQTLNGIIALAEILPEVFEIQVSASDFVREKSNFQARVNVINPFSKHGIADAEIEANLSFEVKDTSEEIEIKAKGKTDADGFAVLKFDIPKLDAAKDAKLIVKAEKNGVVRQATDDELRFADKKTIYFQTDKPLYQPEQTVHVRTTLLNYFSKRPLANKDLVFSIKSEDDQLMQKISVKTSRFGIASFDWQIPENAKLGEYRIIAEPDDEVYEFNQTRFKVSRYDLPNFVVSAKPDQKFYLPETKKAEVEISADYLFGKRVTKGKVRVVSAEYATKWNSKTLEFDIFDDPTVIKGDLDENGKFKAKINLSEWHEDLKPSGWRKYDDVEMVAFVTDESTRRTEQRRFDIRLSKEPIHVYYSQRHNRENADLPWEFYVTAFYADGTPASCDVAINQLINKDKNDNDIDPPELGRLLGRIQTNRFGEAKVSIPFPPDISKDGERIYFRLSAQDAKGKSGTTNEERYFDFDKVLRIETDKIIYRQGDPIKLTILSSESDSLVFIDVLKDEFHSVANARTRITNGRGEISIPFQENFKNDLTIAVYSQRFKNSYDDANQLDFKTITFPSKRGIELEAKMPRDSYKPGEDASVSFKTTRADGDQKDSILGVSIIDRALEERFRTDNEFGKRYYGFDGYFGNILGNQKLSSGISRHDIDNFDMTKPISPEVELAVEIGIGGANYFPHVFQSNSISDEIEIVYTKILAAQLLPSIQKLNAHFQSKGICPIDENSMKQILREEGLEFDSLRDAWGMPFEVKITTDTTRRILKIRTFGADKKPNTDDDFLVVAESWEYFKPLGEALNRATTSYTQRTGAYIRDEKTLRAEMLLQGIDIANWHDYLGNPYRFDFSIDRYNFLVSVRSNGIDGISQPNDKSRFDDFTLWETRVDYFQAIRANITQALNDYVQAKQKFPKDEGEMRKVLGEIGFSLGSLKDVFGRECYLTKQISAKFSDRITIRKIGKEKLNVKPVIQLISSYLLRSLGEDGKRGTNDDFLLATFTGVIQEESKDGLTSKRSVKIVTDEKSGVLSGTVTDGNGAVIPGADVTATNSGTMVAKSVKTNDEGFFIVANLLPGNYDLSVYRAAFKKSLIHNVPVQISSATEVNVTLEVGTVSEVVTVTANSEETVDASSASVSEVRELPINARKASNFVALKQKPNSKTNQDEDLTPNSQETFTPRLREYFPETLYWSPEIVTDKDGNASVKFTVADNITTWKLSALASTEDGEFAYTEKEFQAFQPFFIEHEPPKILTEGDQIALPVLVRNYLEKEQKVSLSMNNEDWFRILGKNQQEIKVSPNASAKTVFNFEAINSVKNGKQKVTALAKDANDAIEKPVSVHPNGREIVQTTGTVFKNSTSFDVNFPANALPKTTKAELKIYPNLMSHVVEAIEGILHRPYGCGEQTISSTYPSLLVLKNSKLGGNSKFRARALRFAKLGYERLIGYKAEKGGFTYWGKGDGNLALSAYALRFLLDAKELIEVDEKVIDETRDWIISQQNENGSWNASYQYGSNLQFTAYATRILAQTSNDEKSKSAVKKALDFLKTQTERFEEPYALANFALAYFASGDTENGAIINVQLRSLAKNEADGIYWNLEANTPFYGSGLAGRIETSALVLQALAKENRSENEQIINKGLQFLLKNKDGYGVWYSTQATINVLDTMLSLISTTEKSDEKSLPKNEIFVNGNKVKEIEGLTGELADNPIFYDLSPFLTANQNRVEIRQKGNQGASSAQIVQRHYVAWNDSAALTERTNDSNKLRLGVDFSKTTAKIGDEISCHVKMERIGFRGYGMLIAEIGLPPGAEVSRESLEDVLKSWDISRYEILPDKIVVYSWVSKGETTFSFTFKPRFGINANSAASMIYDYYNPDSNAVLAPTKFVFK